MPAIRYVIDWPELKQVVKRLLSGDGSDFTRRHNRDIALGYANPRDGWTGFTRGQLERWVTQGYETTAIHGLEDFIPPIREKRRFVFEEEADEFHLDLAWGGADVYMSRFTKRDEIPGLAIEAEIGMSGGTSAYILNAYFTWICRVAFAVESAGIDTEITLQNHVVRLYSEKSNQETMTVVKVKKENEQSDFLSWSAMLSPASLRGLMFIAKTLRCDREGINANSSMGGRVDGRGGWSVKFDPFTRTMKFSTPFDPDGFPEAQMTRELREALKSATQMG